MCDVTAMMAIPVIDTIDGLRVRYREMFRRHHHVHHHHSHFSRGPIPAELPVI
jgi:hypothetical protein